jgi:hypothetical protein
MRQVGGLASALEEELRICRNIGLRPFQEGNAHPRLVARCRGSFGMPVPILRSKAQSAGLAANHPHPVRPPRGQARIGPRQTLNGKPQRKRVVAELGRKFFLIGQRAIHAHTPESNSGLSAFCLRPVLAAMD